MKEVRIQIYVTMANVTVSSGPTDLLVFPWIKFKISLCVENKLMVTKGERGRRDKLGDWDGHIHTTIYKIDN